MISNLRFNSIQIKLLFLIGGNGNMCEIHCWRNNVLLYKLYQAIVCIQIIKILNKICVFEEVEFVLH